MVPSTTNEAEVCVSVQSPQPDLWLEEDNDQFKQLSGFFHSTDIG